jgi:hypothetical protein
MDRDAEKPLRDGFVHYIFFLFTSCAEGFFRSDTPFSFIWFDSFPFYGHLLGGGKGFLLIRYDMLMEVDGAGVSVDR